MNLMDHMQLRAAEGRACSLVVLIASELEVRREWKARYDKRRAEARRKGLCTRCRLRKPKKATRDRQRRNTCEVCRIESRDRKRAKKRAHGGT